MEERSLRPSDPIPPAPAEADLSDAELDDVAGGLARVWLGETVVAGVRGAGTLPAGVA